VGRLRNELIPEGELDLVRKYLWGSFQRSIDGPFALADRHKSLLLAGMGQDYYERYLHTLRTVSPSELQECARTWLQATDLTEVVVGP
jgi:zinc protease